MYCLSWFCVLTRHSGWLLPWLSQVLTFQWQPTQLGYPASPSPGCLGAPLLHVASSSSFSCKVADSALHVAQGSQTHKSGNC